MIVVVPVRCYERACGWPGFVEPAGSAKCPSCAGLLVPARERFELEQVADGIEVCDAAVQRLVAIAIVGHARA